MRRRYVGQQVQSHSDEARLSLVDSKVSLSQSCNVGTCTCLRCSVTFDIHRFQSSGSGSPKESVDGRGIENSCRELYRAHTCGLQGTSRKNDVRSQAHKSASCMLLHVVCLPHNVYLSSQQVTSQLFIKQKPVEICAVSAFFCDW